MLKNIFVVVFVLLFGVLGIVFYKTIKGDFLNGNKNNLIPASFTYSLPSLNEAVPYRPTVSGGTVKVY